MVSYRSTHHPLGKGLERLLAKRIAHTALVEGVISDQHFGPVPGRSAVDLVGCVVHDVEKALDRRHTATLVTVDVKGAFDGVLHNRLLRRMQEQGWPPQLLRWTSSFLSGRSAQVRYPGGVTEPIQLACGVPQGSPASPALFMLYLAEGLQKGSRKCRFGYADDIGLLGVGASKAESAAAAQAEALELVEWAETNAIQFDMTKTEVIQFGGVASEAPASVSVGGQVFTPSPQIRWLGVFLDPKLTFRAHVDFWCAKAQSVATHLRRLSPVQRGAAPGPLVRAVESCVVTVATYGAEVWYPGSSRPTAHGTTKFRITGLLDKIDLVIRMALRGALPVWRTTRIAVLHRESGIPPASILLEGIRLQNSSRLHRLDELHPLRTRAAAASVSGRRGYPYLRPELHDSRAQRTYALLPGGGPPNLVPKAPVSGRM